MNKILLLSLCLTFVKLSFSQSFEFMPGTERIFIDAQYLKFLDDEKKLSLFSRARATTEYDNQENTNLFTGVYLNYTTNSGIGGTVLGRISSFSSGVDIGIHFFKANKKIMVYALPSMNLNSDLLYSWFSIFRYTPLIKDDWKAYTSLELFSAFNKDGHLSSVQRIRIGADKSGFQFGLALNLSEQNRNFENTDVNPGIFLRKQF